MASATSAWGLGMLHGLKSGTDTGVAWVSASTWLRRLLVAAAVCFRLFAATAPVIGARAA